MSDQSDAAARLPLTGMRVLDVSQVMAGPFCCMLLGDLGADVIKIEPPDGGDQTRGAMGFKLKGSDSLGFMNMNRNKRSVALDLKTEEGRAIFYELAKTADVIVENYRPGTMRKLGIDYDTIRALNPGIIYASISGFGQTGPWADRPGFDLIAQAATGIMSITGEAGGPPSKSGVPVADIGCSLFAVYAILAAYIGKTKGGEGKTGEGQYIDASLYEAGIAFAIWDIAEFWGTGKVPQRIGTGNRMSAPYQAMRARDTWFVLGANSDRLWQRLCAVIARPQMTSDPRYLTIADRLTNRETLAADLETSFAREDATFWIEELLAVGIPAGPINDFAEALGNEHALARNVTMEIEHPVEGKVRSIGFPVKLMGTPQQVRRHPPRLGEHTAEVLAELGMSGDVSRTGPAK